MAAHELDTGKSKESHEGLLRIIKNPKHKEYKSMMDWFGCPFDPEAFDLSKINRYLQKLKWPRVTDNQLARVLMARDGHKER